jgi:uncharacterized membrane protein YedE/YeeE
MDWPAYAQSFIGGAMIGLGAAALLVLNGRIAGVSGILGGLLAPLAGRPGGAFAERAAFVVGLLLGPAIFAIASGALPAVEMTDSLLLLGAGGLLVGFGTRLSGGCTSGHGVCGLARLSRRSFAAVATFFAVAILTVFVMEHIL